MTLISVPFEVWTLWVFRVILDSIENILDVGMMILDNLSRYTIQGMVKGLSCMGVQWVGHIFPPIFFLPAVFPPKFSSWQVIFLGLDIPRHYFTLDNSLLLIIHPSLGFPKSQLPNILLWLYSPRHLYSRHIVYPESFPPRIKTSQQQILLAFNSPRT